MEKLQAALARAREKRDNDGRPVRAEFAKTTRSGRQRFAREEATAALWDNIRMFEPQDKRMHQSRIYSSEASVEAQHFDILRTKLLLEMRRNDWAERDEAARRSRRPRSEAGPRLGRRTDA